MLIGLSLGLIPIHWALWKASSNILIIKIYFSLLCYMLLLLSCCAALILLFFVVPKIYRFFVKLAHRRPGTFSLMLAFLSVYIASKAAESMCETLYHKFAAPLESIPRGLNPSSINELVVRGNHPLCIPGEDSGELDDAMIIVHGAQQSPRRMRKIYSYPPFSKRFDLYVPLLLYHRRTLEMMNEINYHEMSRQLLEDIQHVAKNTKGNIYCIGHSMGAGLLCYLSLRGELPARTKLVLYAPAIQTQIGPIMEVIAWMTSFFNKYRVLPDVFGTRGFKSGHNFPEFITTQKLITVLCNSSKILTKMLCEKQMQNEFVCILCKKDPRILSLKVAELLKTQNRLTGMIWLKALHSPHLDVEGDGARNICKAIETAIEALDKKRVPDEKNDKILPFNEAKS